MAVRPYGPIWGKAPITIADDERMSALELEQESLHPSPMVNVPFGARARITPSIADGDLFLWSHIRKETPTYADGECPLWSSSVNHSINRRW